MIKTPPSGKNKSFGIEKLSIYLVFIVLIIFGVLIINKNIININLAKKEEDKTTNNISENLTENPSGSLGYDISNRWKIYQDTIFGYELAIPKLLLERSFTNEGRFEKFVIFEETQYSVEKGVAVGISRLDLKGERDQLLGDMEKEGARMSKEEDIEIDGHPGLLITFEPGEGEGLEEKSVFMVNNGDFTFSVSSVPLQIDRLIDNFKFL